MIRIKIIDHTHYDGYYKNKMENIHVEINMESQRTLNNPNNLEKEEQSWNKAADFTFADLKTYYKATKSKQYCTGTKAYIQTNGIE